MGRAWNQAHPGLPPGPTVGKHRSFDGWACFVCDSPRMKLRRWNGIEAGSRFSSLARNADMPPISEITSFNVPAIGPDDTVQRAAQMMGGPDKP